MRNQDLLQMYIHQFVVAGRGSSRRNSELKNFILFCDEFHDGHINYVVLQSWLKLREKTLAPSGLGAVQNQISAFSEWAHVINENIGVIPKCRYVRRYRRKPTIIDDEQIRNIIAAQRAYKALYRANKINPRTFATITGLLFTTGLRVGEALNLKPSNVDLEGRSIYVPSGKGPKDRTVPLSEETCQVLEKYSDWKDSFKRNSENFFFYDKPNLKHPYASYRSNFINVTTKLGYRKEKCKSSKRSKFTIHDLRHSYAVNSLIQIYESGVEVNDAIVQLSSILGHNNIDDTYDYISSVPKLMAAAFSEQLS